MNDDEDRRIPSNAELYRVLIRIEKALDGNGQPGIRQRLTEVESSVKNHWHPGIVGDLKKVRADTARIGGLLAGGFAVFEILLKVWPWGPGGPGGK